MPGLAVSRGPVYGAGPPPHGWINPSGSRNSQALGIGDGQQVGAAAFDAPGNYSFASVWSGTASSWVNLNPVGAGTSVAISVSNGQQVGYANFPGTGEGPYASLWSGSAESWVNLHAFLPEEFLGSQAQSIWHANGYTYVAGVGFNQDTGRNEALLWVIPAPGSAGLLAFSGLFATRRPRR